VFVHSELKLTVSVSLSALHERRWFAVGTEPFEPIRCPFRHVSSWTLLPCPYIESVVIVSFAACVKQLR